MAIKRMISKKIVDEDDFLDLPSSSRLLYYDLNIRADDEGFVGSVKKIMRITGATMVDLETLVRKKFVLIFETGVIVIRHWYIHNYIRKDTFQETIFQEEKSLLKLNTEGQNKVYDFDETKKQQVDFFSVDGPLTQNRIEQISTDKVSIDNISSPAPAVQLSLPTTTNDLSATTNYEEASTKESNYKSNCSDQELQLVREVINYLNDITGKHFTIDSKATKTKILARIREGRTLEDFKYVISNKSKQWLNNPEFNQYLRPKTLFGSNFENYINEKPYIPNSTNNSNKTFSSKNQNSNNVNNVLQRVFDGTIPIK